MEEEDSELENILDNPEGYLQELDRQRGHVVILLITVMSAIFFVHLISLPFSYSSSFDENTNSTYLSLSYASIPIKEMQNVHVGVYIGLLFLILAFLLWLTWSYLLPIYTGIPRYISDTFPLKKQYRKNLRKLETELGTLCGKYQITYKPKETEEIDDDGETDKVTELRFGNNAFEVSHTKKILRVSAKLSKNNIPVIREAHALLIKLKII